ncbi:hypothetical protein GW17_00039747, partial [Ensete ventricosum]
WLVTAWLPVRGRQATARASSKGAAPARCQIAGAAAHSHAIGFAANGVQTATRDRLLRGGRLRVRHSQEGSLREEASPARAAACKGDRSQEWPPAGASPVRATLVEVPTAGVAAPWQSGCWRARPIAAYAWAVVTTTATHMGQEGLGHPFEKRMILPL